MTRIRAAADRVASAGEAAALVEGGDALGVSGFSNAGYPKAVPAALAEREFDEPISILSGGSLGDEIDNELVGTGNVARRVPYQTKETSRRFANDGRIAYRDHHISRTGDDTRFGHFGGIDVAVVEAVRVTEEGIVPSTSSGNTPAYLHEADTVIVEVNRHQPEALADLHDVYVPGGIPGREPIPITAPDDRIGTSHVPLDPGEIDAVVETDAPDRLYEYGSGDETAARIADNLEGLLREDLAAGRLPADHLALQFGVGAVGNNLLEAIPGLHDAADEISYYGEVLQDGLLDLIERDEIGVASGTSLALTEDGQRRLYDDIGAYADHLVLRPSEVSNSPEVIKRLGVASINSALEVDLYGNVNSTHVYGTDVVNGLGGSGDFARNALLSVMALPSVAAGGDVSRIVPMVPHVDHTEHDIGAVVTEQGVADLRGTAPRERVERVIENCAHPDWRDDLWEYYRRAEERGGHVPHLLDEAFDWHRGWRSG